jgi:hypothetical protein
MLITIESDGDARELDELRIDLSDELALLPLHGIDEVSDGPVPANARAADVTSLSQLLVTFGPSTLTAVATVVQAWLGRSNARKVSLKLGDDSITLSRASAADQRQLLDAFIDKHSAEQAAHGEVPG